MVHGGLRSLKECYPLIWGRSSESHSSQDVDERGSIRVETTPVPHLPHTETQPCTTDRAHARILRLCSVATPVERTFSLKDVSGHGSHEYGYFPYISGCAHLALPGHLALCLEILILPRHRAVTEPSLHVEEDAVYPPIQFNEKTNSPGTLTATWSHALRLPKLKRKGT